MILNGEKLLTLKVIENNCKLLRLSSSHIKNFQENKIQKSNKYKFINILASN